MLKFIKIEPDRVSAPVLIEVGFLSPTNCYIAIGTARALALDILAAISRHDTERHRKHIEAVLDGMEKGRTE